MNGYTGSIKAFSLSNSFLWEYGYQNGNRKYERYITNSNIVNESNNSTPKQSYSVGFNSVKSSGCTLFYLVTYYDDGSMDRDYIGMNCNYSDDCQTTIGISEGSDIIKADCSGKPNGPGGGSGNGDFDKIINDITDPCLKALITNLQNANKLTNAIGGILQNVFGENNNITLTFKQDDNLKDEEEGTPVAGKALKSIDGKNYSIYLNSSMLNQYSQESQTLTIMHEVLHNYFFAENFSKIPNGHTRMLNDYINQMSKSLEDLYPQLKSDPKVSIALCFANLMGSIGVKTNQIKQSDFDIALTNYSERGLLDLNDWYRSAIQAQWANKEDSPLGTPCSKNFKVN